MACPAEHQEWTFRMRNDRTPAQFDTLIFCLRVEGGVVTGTVTDSSGNPLSTDNRVTGRRMTASVPPDKECMDLNFRWDTSPIAIKVFLSGHVFVDSSLDKFVGRFRAYRIGDSQQMVKLLGPGDGDTGTGTGQQT